MSDFGSQLGGICRIVLVLWHKQSLKDSRGLSRSWVSSKALGDFKSPERPYTAMRVLTKLGLQESLMRPQKPGQEEWDPDAPYVTEAVCLKQKHNPEKVSGAPEVLQTKKTILHKSL